MTSIEFKSLIIYYFSAFLKYVKSLGILIDENLTRENLT